jgi:hypothetical protein
MTEFLTIEDAEADALGGSGRLSGTVAPMIRSVRIPDDSTTTMPVARSRESERRLSAQRPIPRRGLSRTEAAMYIGVTGSQSPSSYRCGRSPAIRPADESARGVA